ncbi:hypothetical protein Poli38472_010720 [Pythium oligandrum]|uniref:Uncharacterized protein n=1 Tax=Pythium oligandrum TaxID=41045 RepID=A0A8K1CE70_PYTOL|nr:hypothetical protein Poli38472_010720 [Pythium oligandrum]|eukprot:TMW61657.1 hypothetical protein Poli38472_010720 [Pythium oligandrum]
MDSCGAKTGNDRRNRGELVSVDAFLQHLVGDTSQVRANKATSDAVDAFVGEWSDWLMGFSHFCELREFPTQSLMKSLLAQRGAAVWNHGGDDGFFLLLPIAREDPMMHKDTDVSVMVIHVALIKEQDDPVSAKWIRSTLSQMEACDLVDLDPANVVYVSMRMRGSHHTPVHKARYVVKKKNKRNDLVLCLNGVSWWANPAVIPWIAPAVVEQLEKFLEYDSNPMHSMKALMEFQKEPHPFAQELRSMRVIMPWARF